MDEIRLFVIYDIPNDKIRNKVGEICKDYGLKRIQYSGFSGSLSKNKREELFLKLKETLGEAAGKIVVQPVCEKCSANAFSLINAPKLEAKKEGEKAPDMKSYWEGIWNTPLRATLKQDDGY